MNSTFYETLDVLYGIAIAGWCLVVAGISYVAYHVFICKTCKEGK